MRTERRSALKKLLLSAVGVTGFGLFANASSKETAAEKEVGNITTVDDVPLFSGHTKIGNMIFVAGKGAHVAPNTIEAHTDIVLKELEAELIKAGSSMSNLPSSSSAVVASGFCTMATFVTGLTAALLFLA